MSGRHRTKKENEIGYLLQRMGRWIDGIQEGGGMTNRDSKTIEGHEVVGVRAEAGKWRMT